MSLRFLFQMFAPLLPDEYNASETKEVSERAIGYIPAAAKLHIGMLTISLLVGLAFGGFVIYTSLKEKEVFLVYIRNLVIALVCRTFFTVIFDGVVLLEVRTIVGLLEGTTDVAGANTLSSLEQIFLNLVLAFWLSLTVYAHARVQRNFKSEPTLRLYQYGIPAVGVFFAFIWIFVMQGAHPNEIWWVRVVILEQVKQWIVNSANLLFLLIQLGLVADICRMMMARKGSLDNDTLSLLWRVAAMFGALILIFWLQFGLSLGPYIRSESYLNFFYFMDGSQGALVCLCLYFFHKWVVTVLNNKYGSFSGSGDTLVRTESNDEELLPGGRGIVTIDSVFVTRESGRWKTSREEESKDVLYSNVVEPHRLQKTLELYKRLNIIPNQVTVVEGDEFYDCQIPAEYQMENQKPSLNTVSKEEDFKFKNEKILEPIQKKNAFYSSKYLILDSKDGAFPKYLETRPSVSSVSEKDQQMSRVPPSVESGELVRTWLKDHTEVMQQDRKPLSVTQDEQKELQKENLGRKASTYDFPTTTEALYDSPGPILSGKDKVHKTHKMSAIPVPEVNESQTRSQPVEPHTKDEKNKEFQDNKKQMEATKVPEHINKEEELKPSESNVSQPLDVSKLHPKQHEILNEKVPVSSAPTNLGLPQAKQEPTEPSNSFLTYTELLEYRSKEGISDDPPHHSLSDSIFSKLDSLIIAGGSLLNSLTGFSQTEHEADNFRTDDILSRQSRRDSMSKPGQQEELKEPETNEDFKIYDTPIKEPQDDLKSKIKLPERTVEDDEDDEFRFQSKTANAELPAENKMKINVSEMPQFEEQSRRIYIKPTDIKPQQKLREIQPLRDSLEDEEESPTISSDSEFSIERRQSDASEILYRRLSKPTKKYKWMTSDAGTEPYETSDLESNAEKKTSSSSEFSLEQYYTQVLSAADKLENQPSPLRFNKKYLNK